MWLIVKAGGSPAGVQTSVDGGACPAILHCVKSGRKRSVEKCVCSD